MRMEHLTVEFMRKINYMDISIFPYVWATVLILEHPAATIYEITTSPFGTPRDDKRGHCEERGEVPMYREQSHM